MRHHASVTTRAVVAIAAGLLLLPACAKHKTPSLYERARADLCHSGNDLGATAEQRAQLSQDVADDPWLAGFCLGSREAGAELKAPGSSPEFQQILDGAHDAKALADERCPLSRNSRALPYLPCSNQSLHSS